jgi:hypothetical protein
MAEITAIEEERRRSKEKTASRRNTWKIWSMFGNRRRATA